MPDFSGNDIDFAIHPEDLYKFIIFLKTFKECYSASVDLYFSRFEVLKLNIKLNELSVDLDFWFGFNYAGLYYMDICQVLNRSCNYKIIRILQLEDEVSLSFLKELLHMNRLREDKIDELSLKLKKTKSRVFPRYFNDKYQKLFLEAIVGRRFILKSLSFKAKMVLLAYNLRDKGFFGLIKNILLFVSYRFFPPINPLVKNFRGIFG